LHPTRDTAKVRTWGGVPVRFVEVARKGWERGLVTRICIRKEGAGWGGKETSMNMKEIVSVKGQRHKAWRVDTTEPPNMAGGKRKALLLRMGKTQEGRGNGEAFIQRGLGA